MHLRQVRSFARRESRMSETQKKAVEDLMPAYGIPKEKCLYDFSSIFARDAKLIIEIGFGSGQSLIKMALNQPEDNFIGIEVYKPGIGAFLNEVKKNNINNIRVIDRDAIDVLEENVPDNSVDVLQAFFPDPWPKKRHHKRRLIKSEFIEIIENKLKSFGTLHLATDHFGYAEHMLEVLNNSKAFKNISETGDYIKRPESRPVTKYEQRGLRLGMVIYDLIFKKVM